MWVYSDKSVADWVSAVPESNRSVLPGNTNYSDSIMGCIRSMLLVLRSLVVRAHSVSTPQNGVAASFSFGQYGQSESLSQGTGYAIAKFDDFMWIGTQDGWYLDF